MSVVALAAWVGWRPRLAVLLAGAWLAIVPALAAQPPVRLAPGTVSVPLGDAVMRLEDPGGKLSLQDVRARDADFAPGTTRIGTSASAWWFRIPLRNEAASETWWLDTGNRTLNELDVHVVGRAGVRHQSASADRPFADRPVPSGTFVFPVTVPAGTDAVVYIRARSTGWIGMSLAPHLWAPAAYEEQGRSREIQWFVYGGIGIALGLFNLLLFAVLRDRMYLLYVLSVLSMVAATSCTYGSFGLAYKYLWPESPLADRMMVVTSILASGVIPSAFVMSYAGAASKVPRLYRAWLLVIAVFVAATLPRVAFSWWPGAVPVAVQHVFTRAGLASFGVMVVVSTIVLLVLVARKDRAARVLAVAWAPVAATALLTSFQNVGSPVGPLMWASAVEFILMSLALGDRFNQERQGRERAQAELVDTLRRSERELEEKVRLRTAELRQEQARTQDLLHNILPVQVAEELSRTGRTTPRRHEAVTILFSDFSGFTRAASSLHADQLVAELDEVFGAFDRIADECGVEKIKTIGDAYMAVAGLDGCADHADRAVRMALRMMEFMRRRNATAPLAWELRIGMHSGPVVSGVVGHRKYAFDIWGDSVNVASRMESSSELGRINLSASTHALVRGVAHCTYRGKLEVKGKGAIDMYFVADPA